jgi:anti-sigma regulatory factor (Ser/Thr protein kinase)
VIRPRRPGSPVDGEGDRVVSRPNAFAGHLRLPTEAGLRPQQRDSTGGSRPSAGTSQKGGPTGRRRNWRLPATQSSVTCLRRGLTDFLREADLSDDERYDLLLAVCEAASNAIEHARNPSEPFFDVLTEIAEARVTVVVRDHGQWSDRRPGVHRGRGMAMMWMLADSRVVTSPQGTTVTIRSSARHPRPPVPPHDERGTAGGSPFPSSAVDSP